MTFPPLRGGWTSDARVYGVSQLGGETFFFGQSDTELGLPQATIWNRSGVPLESEFLSTAGNFHQMTETGYLTGEQAGAGVVWTPDGRAHILPMPDLAKIINSGSIGLDMMSSGRFISGQIGSDAVIWEAIGNRASGNYQYISYNEGPFPHRLMVPPDGFGPDAALHIIDSDQGVVVVTNYRSSAGPRSGVWSARTGQFIVGFGHSAVMKPINIDGNVFVATNDFTENSGAIWLLGQDQPVYLRDMLGSEFQNPYFTPGGLFALPNGEGIGILGTGTVDGVETHFMAQIKFVDEVFEYRVDFDHDGEFDVFHLGSAKTDIPIRIDRSGSYTVKVQVRRPGGDSGDVLAEAYTTIDVTPFPEGQSAAQIPLDTNGDGILTPLDALMVLNHIARVNRGVEEFDLGRFDVSGSGSVTPLDALLILNQMRQGDGPGQYLPSIELSNDSGVPGDGLTNDPSIIGQLPTHGEVYMQIGDTVRNVSEARNYEGRFVFPKEDLFELFPGTVNDGDYEVQIWTGLENVPDYLKTNFKFAYKGTPPRDFEILGLNEDREFTWEASQGASRYDVGYRNLAGGAVNWISQDLRDTSSSLGASIEEAIELIVLARDAAGNQTEQAFPLMSA